MKTFGKAKMGLSESTSLDPTIHLIQLHLKEIHTFTEIHEKDVYFGSVIAREKIKEKLNNGIFIAVHPNQPLKKFKDLRIFETKGKKKAEYRSMILFM